MECFFIVTFLLCLYPYPMSHPSSHNSYASFHHILPSFHVTPPDFHSSPLSYIPSFLPLTCLPTCSYLASIPRPHPTPWRPNIPHLHLTTRLNLPRTLQATPSLVPYLSPRSAPLPNPVAPSWRYYLLHLLLWQTPSPEVYVWFTWSSYFYRRAAARLFLCPPASDSRCSVDLQQVDAPVAWLEQRTRRSRRSRGMMSGYSRVSPWFKCRFRSFY